MPADHAYLLRHCDPENPGNYVYGQLPGYPLSTLGRRQAQDLANLLAGQPVTYVVASPQLRAQQTAQIIASQFGLDVATDVNLREADFSLRIQGLRWRTVLMRKPVYWIHRLYPGVVRGDERPAAMADRVEQALATARQNAGDGVAVCVSHADPICALWSQVMGRIGRWSLRSPIAKGSLIEVAYQRDRLVSATYTPPAAVASFSVRPVSSLESA